tara:strand:- start:1183 stop:1416 length:234 start_codon:yes stop_codon:yes gene_type:complete
MLISSESSFGDLDFSISFKLSASFKKQDCEVDSVGKLLVKSSDLAGEITIFIISIDLFKITKDKNKYQNVNRKIYYN